MFSCINNSEKNNYVIDSGERLLILLITANQIHPILQKLRPQIGTDSSHVSINLPNMQFEPEN